MFLRRKKRSEELEDRVCEQVILLHHQEELLKMKDGEIAALKKQNEELMEQRTVDEEQPTVKQLLDEWLNGKRGER